MRVSGIMDNQVLQASMAAWLIAQALKGLIFLVRNKRFDFQRFAGPGGMPSAHSAFVVSLAAAVGLDSGFDSTIFAVSLVFAMIVMYDASGIRMAVGRQAAVLNIIVDELHERGRVEENRLKELLGHTPVEVIAGAALGLVVALLMVQR